MASAAQNEDDDGFPPIAPLAVILGVIALDVWILLHNDHHHGGSNGGGNGSGEAPGGLLGGFVGGLLQPISPA